MFTWRSSTIRNIILKIPEADCTTIDSTWSNVVTEPALPVVHGTTLTLNCPGGYTNLGGITATCLYGQVVPTDGSPDCRGEYKTVHELILSKS